MLFKDVPAKRLTAFQPVTNILQIPDLRNRRGYHLELAQMRVISLHSPKRI